jgi:uncharacterized protein
VDALTNRGKGAEPFGVAVLCLSIIGIFILGIVIASLAGLAATLIDAALFGWKPTFERIDQIQHVLFNEQSHLGQRALVVLSIVIYGAITVAILAFAHWRGGQAWRDLIAWRTPIIPATDRWLWVIVACALLYGVAASLALGQIDEHSHLGFKLFHDHVANLALVMLAVVVAPVTEELLFRGWIYTGLRYRLGMWPALVLSSAVFAFAHYEDTHIYALVVFPIGLALGGMRERTGSTKAPILFHAFYNLAAVLLVLFE